MRKSTAFFASVFVAFSLSAFAGGEDSGRLDIDGKSAKVELQPVSCDRGKIAFGAWQRPDDVKRYLTCDLEGARGKWTEAKFSLIPKGDGKLTLTFLGPYVDGGTKTSAKPLGVLYDDVKVDGVLIENGDFSKGAAAWSLEKGKDSIPARIEKDSESGNCVLAWHNAPARTSIAVKGGHQVDVSFRFKPIGEIGPETKANEFFPLSLAKVANMGFADEKEGDGQGGWTDQGPRNDLRKFDPSKKDFLGVPFEIVDPARNDGRSCVVFKSEHSQFGAPSVKIPVGRSCNAIFFLNACAWSGAKGLKVAEAVATFVDGSEETFDFVSRVNTGDWWVKSVPEAEIAWKAGAAENGEVGLYKTVWKLSKEAEVKEIEIRPVGGKTIFALVGLCAAKVYNDPSLPLIGSNFKFKIDEAAKFTAIGLDSLKLEMREAGGDPEAFFDPFKYLGRISVSGPDGKRVDSAMVVFKRKLPSVALVKTDGATGVFTMKIESEPIPGSPFTPSAALKKIAGLDGVDYEPEAFRVDGVTLSCSDFLKSKGVSRMREEDSFFLNGVAFASDASVECDVVFPKAMPYAQFRVLSRDNEPFKNNVWLDIFGEHIKIGGNGPLTTSFYWQCGMAMEIPAGTHKIKISPSRAKASDRKDFALSLFQFADSKKTPHDPDILDELKALKSAGVAIYKPVALRDPAKPKADPSPFLSIVSASASYPDLSYMSADGIGRHGFMRPDGNVFKYQDGSKLPFIWGCNIGYHALYMAFRPDRLGGDFDDLLFGRIKALGYDTVRYMPETLNFIPGHNQNNVVYPLISTKPLEYTPFFLESIRRLVAACHKNQLHLFYTLWHDNCAFTDLGATRHDKSYIRFFHPEAIERLKQQTRETLATPNPYRGGIAPIDDPTLSIIEIENERNFVEMWNKAHPTDWRNLQKDTRDILYARWASFLKDKYKSFDALKRNYGKVSLRSGFDESKGFDAVEFAPVWDVKEWGEDSSDFKMEFDDLRVSSAAFGKERKSNPAVSDGLEFMYVVYRDFIAEMTRFLREDLGYKGVIYSNGPDTELHYSQRRAIAELGDAVSGGTGYWNREGYGFLRDFSWLSPMVFASNNGKPVISREYGPNLPFKNCWWGNLITACAQRYFGEAYLFNFCLGIPSSHLPDYLYPLDLSERLGHVELNQDADLHSSFANMAGAIALHSGNIETPKFKVDIGLPYGNTFYAAPFRGYNKLSIKDYGPFLYTPAGIRVFDGKYDGDADLVVNEPSLPEGDYSAAKKLFLCKPHSSLDRYGVDASAWEKGKTFKADGFIDTQVEQDAFYSALKDAGCPMPVSRAEFGKVWRSIDKSLEIDTAALSFKADQRDFGAFIGLLDGNVSKMPRQFTASGKGDAWIFSGLYKQGKANSILMAVMDGVVDLTPGKPLDYVFLGGGDLEVRRGGKSLLKLLGPSETDIAIKSKDGADIAGAKELYVSFFRNKSCESPAKISLNLGRLASIDACDRLGNSIASVPFVVAKDGAASFENPWFDGARISYFRVRMAD